MSTQPNPDWQQKLFVYLQSMYGLTLTETDLRDLQAQIYPPVIDESECIVQKEQLQRWLDKIQGAKKYELEVQQDIGWVVEQIHNLVQSVGDEPMKFLQQILMKLTKDKIMGKKGDDQPMLKMIGLDVDRLQAIGAKYAPDTVKKLETENKK